MIHFQHVNFMKKVNIFYNNADFFSSKNLPTPEVKRSTSDVFFGDKKGVKEKIELNGQIYFSEEIANCDYFNFLKQRRDELVQAFSEDFKKLEIKEDGEIILQKDFCIISEISFPEQDYKKTLAYSIKIECYDELTHNEFYGIDKPVNSTSIEKMEDDVYSIQRSISANGINTQDGELNGLNDTEISSALQNAIDFVDNFRGRNNTSKPLGSENAALILTSESEKIDRISNSVQVQENYLLDKNGSSSDVGVVRYAINKSSTFGGINQIEISGEITAGIDSNFNDVRNQVKDIDFYQEIINAYGDEGYNRIPGSISFNENERAGTISFSLNFNNDDSFNECGVSTQLNTSISVGEDSVVSLSIDGLILAQGPIEERWRLVHSNFINKPYDSVLYESWAHQEAQQEINQFLTNVTLLGEPESSSIEENQKGGEIKFNYNFSNKDKPEDFKNFQCSSSVNMRSPKYSVDMNFGGGMNQYTVTRSGFTKGSVSINASGEYINKTGNEENDKDNALNKLTEKINSIFLTMEQEFFSSEEKVKIGQNKSYNINNSQASIAETREYFDSVV